MLISLLIMILIAALICAVIFWVVDFAPVPAPFNRIVKIAVVVIALLYILQRSGLGI